ncbi:MAG: M28 family peptidase [Flavobacteriales bacterium]|nr:M28 family peptidase [Flavobacteriales bacterium]
MKRLLLFLYILLSSYYSASAQSYNSFYGGVVNNCSYDSINNHLIDFENLGVKELGTSALNNTLDWLINFYQSYGYTDIEIDTFTYNGGEVYNLIVTKTGTHYPNTYYILDGHYDTKTGTGTNDNGTGTAIILETARLMKDVDTKFSVKFIHFSMEEVGLVGSAHYVNNVAFPSGMDIKVLLNIDEVGGINGMVNNSVVCERDGNTPTAANADSWAYTDTLANCVELYSSLATTKSYAYASDYMPFQAKGYIITGLFEDHYSPYPHTAADSLGNVDIPYVFEIAKAAVGASLYFAIAYESTGIKKFDYTNFLVYPNPVKDVLTITSENLHLPITIRLINTIGEIVKTELINSTTHLINVEELPNGIYYLQVENKSGFNSKKIVIMK